MNVEIKAGKIYNVRDIAYGDGKKYLTFTVGTYRDYTEKGKRKLNYRLCRVYNEILQSYILEKFTKDNATIFYFEGETYDDKYTDVVGKQHYEHYFKIHKGKASPQRVDYSKEDEVDVGW